MKSSNWIAAVSAIAVVAAFTWFTPFAIKSLPQAPAHSVSAIARMQSETWLVKTPSGAGSAIHLRAVNGLPQLLTAAHVVDDLESNAVVIVSQLRRGPDGYTARYEVKARVVWVRSDWDVALLEAATPEGFGPGAVFGKTALIGDKLRHVGFFLGSDMGQSYSEGIVSALDVRPVLPGWPWKNALDQMILSGLPGSSGGPIFNDRGEVVGILVGGYNCSIMFYVPVRQILPLLKKPA
jgi:S1-C subfamily serine protease